MEDAREVFHKAQRNNERKRKMVKGFYYSMVTLAVFAVAFVIFVCYCGI